MIRIRFVRFSKHAEERIDSRLNKLVSKDEVVRAIAIKREFDSGRTYLQIKKVEFTEVADPSVKPDGIARGDTIVAALDVEQNICHVTTVMLRKARSNSNIYTKIVS
jgi:hypothetical protein